MPPGDKKEFTFFLTNAGINPNTKDEKYFAKAKQVMRFVIEKKIFLRPKDEVQILLAAPHTVDDDTTKPNYMQMLSQATVPSWEMVEKVVNLEQSNKLFTNWRKAFSRIIKFIQDADVSGRTVLLLLFDCDSCPPAALKNQEELVNSLLELNINLLWIGSKPLNDIPREKLNDSEKFLMQIIDKVKGKYIPIDKSLESLRIYEKRTGVFLAWNSVLEIGSKIKISVKAYVQAHKEIKAPSFKTISTVSEAGTAINVVKSEGEFIDRYKEVCDDENMIGGYEYGGKFIPVNEADAPGLAYKSGSKSLKLIGFIAEDSIGLEDLANDSSRILLPQTTGEAKRFYCLARAMVNKKRLAIVRRVYRDNTAPKMGLLIPHLDVPGEPWCFILIDIFYVDERLVQNAYPLSSVMNGLTKDKEDIIDEFIDALMLTDDVSEENKDLFAPGTVPSPGIQHLYNCLSHRALYPEDPVPHMADYLEDLLEPPESIMTQHEEIIQQVKSCFAIKDKQDTATSQNRGIPIPMLEAMQKLEDEMKMSVDDDTDSVEPTAEIDLDALFDAGGM